MHKIKKNLSAIEQKFETLKRTHKAYDQPTPIGQVAEIMTYGVVSKKQVNQYLQYVQSEQTSVQNNWLQLTIQQMILLFDKIIKHRNLKKPTDSIKKQRLNIVPWEKIKTKMSNKIAHQNPYVPKKIGTKNQNQLFNVSQNKSQICTQQRIQNQGQSDQQFEPKVSQLLVKNKKNQLTSQGSNTKTQMQRKAELQTFINLPLDFKSYPVKDRFIFLQTTFSQTKSNLQKKFNMIYTHYQKQMYIPHQTFKTNEQLLLDLRMFLRYYRDFQIAQNFKTNIATNHFKKLSLNGIWLDFQNFTEIHYRLIEIIVLNQQEHLQMVQNGEKNEKGKQKQLKKLLSKNIKLTMQNLMKLKQLTDIISDEKIKKLMNDNAGKKIINKIVEVHSGFVKEDILQRLKQRIEEKKKKSKAQNNSRYLQMNFNSQSSGKIQSYSKDLYASVKSNPSYLSIYKQLLIPNLGTNEMKKSSIYSSLQLLSMHKQMERLKQLINEEQNQKYLEAYFKKQKILSSLFRSNTIRSSMYQKHDLHDPLALTQKQNALNSQRKNNIIKKSISLPRMKFS